MGLVIRGHLLDSKYVSKSAIKYFFTLWNKCKRIGTRYITNKDTGGIRMDKFIKFDSMITPMIIKIIFWIGVGLSVLSGLGIIISGFSAYYGGGFQVFLGLVVIVVGPLVIRIYCELLIVVFKMHDALQTIKDNTTPKEKSTSHLSE